MEGVLTSQTKALRLNHGTFRNSFSVRIHRPPTAPPTPSFLPTHLCALFYLLIAMCAGVLLACVSTYRTYTHCLKRWEEDVRSIWYCTCRLLCAIMGLLGTKAGSSIRAATVLYCWPISCRTSFLRSSSTICASHFPFNVCPSIECGWPTGVTHLKKTPPPPLSLSLS